jgi:hypothetical protein
MLLVSDPFRRHAFERMAARGITVADVLLVLREGEHIEEYSDDTPFPSALLSGTVDGRRLHVVAAHDAAEDVTYVITTYEPDPAEWDPSFRRRRA